MDTSKKYIKMCEEAGEIQELKKVRDVAHDFYTDVDQCTTIWRTVWLPRQDQLQEMVLEYEDVVEKVQSLKDFIFITHKKIGQNSVWMTDSYIIALKSMEQLWLCFVMKEKFNKQWKDGTWKKAN